MIRKGEIMVNGHKVIYICCAKYTPERWYLGWVKDLTINENAVVLRPAINYFTPPGGNINELLIDQEKCRVNMCDEIMVYNPLDRMDTFMKDIITYGKALGKKIRYTYRHDDGNTNYPEDEGGTTYYGG